MQPGIYDSKNNLIKSYEELVEEGLDLCRRYGEYAINDEPFSARNLFLKYKPSKLVLPDNLKEIGRRALSYCNSLEEVILGKNIEKIGDYAFTNSINLKKIVFSDKITDFYYGTFYGCENLEIEIPSTIKRIHDLAFSKCYKTKEITIPESVKIIDQKAFMDTNLVKIYLPDSLKRLDFNAFANCSYLEQVRLPDNVMINPKAFEYNPSLKQINVSRIFVENHPDFAANFKNKLNIPKTLDELVNEGTSFKEINKKFKNNNIER